MPQTLVALVGTNPTPILLSALTYRPRRLVLVHSAGTAAQARRIAERFTDVERSAAADLFCLGQDVGDFSAVQEGYARLLEEYGTALADTPWRLCFTGGTKPMSVVFALEHAELFPERHDWRGYVDATGGDIRFTDGSGRPVDHRGLSVAALAALHGVELARTPDHELVELVARQPRRGEQEVRRRLPDARHLAGVLAEGRVLRCFRELAAHAAAGEVEVAHSLFVPDPRPGRGGGQHAIGDFDLVVRHRHRVLCVECKTAPQDVPRSAGWTVTKARRVFGDAALVLFVYRGGSSGELAANPRLDRVTDDDVWAFNRHLRGQAGRRPQVRVLTDRQVRELGPGWAEELFGPEPRKWERRGVLPPIAPGEATGRDPLLISAVGGSRLGVLGAVYAHRPARTVLVRTPEIDVTTLRPPVEAAMAHARGEPVPPPRRGRRSRRGGGSGAVSCLDRAVAAADIPAAVEAVRAEIHRARREGRPVVLDVTAGSKAASVALALAAHAVDTIAYTDPLTRRVSVFTPADPEPARPFDAPEVAWSSVLGGYEPLDRPLPAVVGRFAAQQVDAELLEEAARVVADRAEARGRRARRWVDGEARALPGQPTGYRWTDGELGQFAAQERPTLVVTVADRAVGLTAPRERHHRYRRGVDVYPPEPDRMRRLTAGEWAHSVYAAASRLSALCGVAGRTLALAHGVGLDPNRTADLVDWHSYATAYQDAHRPRVLGARPGETAFAEDVDEVLDELGL
ncbi:hypothetical protein NI17_004030 [Thermobifida halotolerans]|uniref:CRISPR-associated protein n=1 Tax=Thermobifida halotolerans TaxID=483545 RepID=A0AA97LYW3_9ACTN|nr:hypothetical protein [Thermobifida halotolerans]UOE20413.1 hypothetical protein NI17_004030 [Thermobifida halotolerans]